MACPATRGSFPTARIPAVPSGSRQRKWDISPTPRPLIPSAAESKPGALIDYVRDRLAGFVDVGNRSRRRRPFNSCHHRPQTVAASSGVVLDVVLATVERGFSKALFRSSGRLCRAWRIDMKGYSGLVLAKCPRRSRSRCCARQSWCTRCSMTRKSAAQCSACGVLELASSCVAVHIGEPTCARPQGQAGQRAVMCTRARLRLFHAAG